MQKSYVSTQRGCQFRRQLQEYFEQIIDFEKMLL